MTLRRAELFGHGCRRGIVVFVEHLGHVAVVAHILMPDLVRSDLFVSLIVSGASEG